MTPPAEGWILLFDGVCNLCDASVQFIIKRDPASRFRFASLQSEAGRHLLKRHDLSADTLDSVVLIEDGVAYRNSAAALLVARGLKWPWPLLYGFIALPRPVRDAVYRFVARRRYRWFGKKEICSRPRPEQQARFLE